MREAEEQKKIDAKEKEKLMVQKNIIINIFLHHQLIKFLTLFDLNYRDGASPLKATRNLSHTACTACGRAHTSM